MLALISLVGCGETNKNKVTDFMSEEIATACRNRFKDAQTKFAPILDLYSDTAVLPFLNVDTFLNEASADTKILRAVFAKTYLQNNGQTQFIATKFSNGVLTIAQAKPETYVSITKWAKGNAICLDENTSFFGYEPEWLNPAAVVVHKSDDPMDWEFLYDDVNVYSNGALALLKFLKLKTFRSPQHLVGSH
jgi:hypothetical protein